MNNCNDFWQHADYLPLDLVITYWCEQSGFNSTHCRDAKKAAILAAITNATIKFRRSDSKPTKLSAGVTAWQAGQIRAWMAAQANV